MRLHKKKKTTNGNVSFQFVYAPKYPFRLNGNFERKIEKFSTLYVTIVPRYM
jgi:hypothetical protein